MRRKAQRDRPLGRVGAEAAVGNERRQQIAGAAFPEASDASCLAARRLPRSLSAPIVLTTPADLIKCRRPAKKLLRFAARFGEIIGRSSSVPVVLNGSCLQSTAA
jgi:hypothetical protein